MLLKGRMVQKEEQWQVEAPVISSGYKVMVESSQKKTTVPLANMVAIVNG